MSLTTTIYKSDKIRSLVIIELVEEISGLLARIVAPEYKFKENQDRIDQLVVKASKMVRNFHEWIHLIMTSKMVIYIQISGRYAHIEKLQN